MPGAVESFKAGYLDGYSAARRHMHWLLEDGLTPEQSLAQLKAHYAVLLTWRMSRSNDAAPRLDGGQVQQMNLSI